MKSLSSKIKGALPDLECDDSFPVVQAKPIGQKRQDTLRENIFGHIRAQSPERDAVVDSWWEAYLNRVKTHTKNVPSPDDESTKGVKKAGKFLSEIAKKGRAGPFKLTGASVL